MLMMGMGAFPLAAQSDPASNTSTTTTDPVTGATLTLSGSSGFWNATSPYLWQNVLAGTFNGSTLTMPTSTSDPLASAVLNNGALYVSGPSTGTNTSVLTILGSPSVSTIGSTSLSGSLIRPETITNTISSSIVMGPTLPSTPSPTTWLTLTGGQTSTTTTSGTISLANTVGGSSNLTISGTAGLIRTGVGVTTTVSNSTSLNLTTNQLITSTGTVTLSNSSSNLTVSQGTLSFQNPANVSGNLDLLSNSNLKLLLPGTSSNLASAVITVGGDVTLSGDLTVIPSANVPAGSTIVIVNKTSAGAITGTFTGRPQGSLVRGSNGDFIISYAGGDGNDVTLTAVSKLQAWRHAHFGTIDNIGTAADTADADGDGIPNLMERACNLNPAASSTLPVTTALSGANLEYSYIRSVASVQAGDVFTVEWNDSLNPAGWSSAGVIQQVLTDDGTVQSVKAFVPAGDSGQRFIRLRVTPAP